MNRDEENCSMPLTDIERAELQYHRRKAAERNDQMIEEYQANPMTGGPKLRDALLMAGHKIIEDDGNYVFTSPPAPLRSFVAVYVLGAGIVTILILSAMTAGWL